MYVEYKTYFDFSHFTLLLTATQLRLFFSQLPIGVSMFWVHLKKKMFTFLWLHAEIEAMLPWQWVTWYWKTIRKAVHLTDVPKYLTSSHTPAPLNMTCSHLCSYTRTKIAKVVSAATFETEGSFFWTKLVQFEKWWKINFWIQLLFCLTEIFSLRGKKNVRSFPLPRHCGYIS